MDQPTTFTDIETSFHSMPLTKYRIDPGLEKQWLETALADYELELNVALDYDSESESFSNKLYPYFGFDDVCQLSSKRAEPCYGA